MAQARVHGPAIPVHGALSALDNPVTATKQSSQSSAHIVHAMTATRCRNGCTYRWTARMLAARPKVSMTDFSTARIDVVVTFPKLT